MGAGHNRLALDVKRKGVKDEVFINPVRVSVHMCVNMCVCVLRQISLSFSCEVCTKRQHMSCEPYVVWRNFALFCHKFPNGEVAGSFQGRKLHLRTKGKGWHRCSLTPSSRKDRTNAKFSGRKRQRRNPIASIL